MDRLCQDRINRHRLAGCVGAGQKYIAVRMDRILDRIGQKRMIQLVRLQIKLTVLRPCKLWLTPFSHHLAVRGSRKHTVQITDRLIHHI